MSGIVGVRIIKIVTASSCLFIPVCRGPHWSQLTHAHPVSQAYIQPLDSKAARYLQSTSTIFWPFCLHDRATLAYCELTLAWQAVRFKFRLGSKFDRSTVVPGMLSKMLSSKVSIRAPMLGISTFFLQSLVPALTRTTFGKRYKEFCRAPAIWLTV